MNNYQLLNWHPELRLYLAYYASRVTSADDVYVGDRVSYRICKGGNVYTGVARWIDKQYGVIALDTMRDDCRYDSTEPKVDADVWVYRFESHWRI